MVPCGWCLTSCNYTGYSLQRCMMQGSFFRIWTIVKIRLPLTLSPRPRWKVHDALLTSDWWRVVCHCRHITPSLLSIFDSREYAPDLGVDRDWRAQISNGTLHSMVSKNEQYWPNICFMGYYILFCVQQWSHVSVLAEFQVHNLLACDVIVVQ